MKVFAAILMVTVAAGVFVGGWLGYFINDSVASERIDTLQNELTTLQVELGTRPSPS
jgi:hypothetical protein